MIDNLDNQEAPEYGYGDMVVISDTQDPNNPQNIFAQVTKVNDDGTYTVETTAKNGERVATIIQPKQINHAFQGVFSANEAPKQVVYTDPKTGETKTGIIQLDTEDSQHAFSNGKALIDNQYIPFENIEGQYEEYQPTEAQGQGQLKTEGAQPTEGANAQTQTGQEQETGVKIEYPLDKKGGLDFASFTPEHHYQYAVETEGESVAQQDLKNAIKDQFNKIQAHKKKIENAQLKCNTLNTQANVQKKPPK